MNNLKKLGVLCVVLVVMISGCATNPETRKTNLVLVSKKKEQSLGDDLHKSILLENKPYPDEELQLYVNLIGNQLASHAARQDIDYRFTVLDSEDVNAFAGPSGHIYITKNMLTHLNKESHLAAVLAHEIGHISARHTARKLTKNKLHNAFSGTIEYLNMFVGLLGTEGVSNALERSRIAYINGYGRDLELEADTLGAEYLAKAGYQPEDMIDVLSILKDQEQYVAGQIKQEIEQNLVISYHASNTATHPRSDVRLQQAIAVAENFLNTQDPQADIRDYLTMIDGINVESEQRLTMRSSSVSKHQFNQHLKGFLPSQFAGYSENSLPAEERGLMLPSSSSSGYLIALDSDYEEQKTFDEFGKYSGLVTKPAKSVLLIRTQEKNESVTPREFLDDYLKRGDTEFQRVGGGKVKTPYGEGYFLRSVSRRTYQQLGFIGKPQTVIAEGMHGVVFVGDRVAVVETFVNGAFGISRMPHQRIFKSIMRNIRPLGAPDILHDEILKRDYTIALKVVEPGETIESIASDVLVPEAETKLRLINGYYPSGEPEFGQTIKTFVAR